MRGNLTMRLPSKTWQPHRNFNEWIGASRLTFGNPQPASLREAGMMANFPHFAKEIEPFYGILLRLLL
jgi:hypothetical protein